MSDPDGGPAASAPPVRRLLVVPSPDPVRLARACAGLGADGHVVPADGICVVVLDDAVDVDAVVPRLSRVLGRAPVLLLRSGGGRVEARRWTRGAVTDAPQAGLLVATLPDVVSSLLVGALDPAQAPGSVRTGLRPKPVDAGAGGPPPDPGRPARRRRTDRAAAAVVAVVALLLAAVEGARAATADGSWTVVVLALLVAVGMGVLAVRLRPRATASPEDRPLVSPEDGPLASPEDGPPASPEDGPPVPPS